MTEKIIKKSELSKYNGKNGNPGYVAVDGKVYDVTNCPAWKNGEHHGNYAGTDITYALMHEAPHGSKVLSKVPLVGKLVDD